ncbi:MAG: hypothetical protein K2N48_10610 [Muribaculaceae bacterium]|nr:hypothetical protein [Muribaculaceae bacterium]
MKEKDLKKCLDNLIINGLIQEAEQDNTEFETAMREMSDEDFLALIYDTADEPIAASFSPTYTSTNMDTEFISNKESSVMPIAPNRDMLTHANRVSYEWNEWDAPAPLNKTKFPTLNKGWKIWTAAIASVAAILLIVFVPAHMDMDSRLCESALLASEAYGTPSRGIDIPSMRNDEVKAMLPELEKEYYISIKDAKGIVVEETGENEDNSYYIEHFTPQEAGTDLLQAYLKLGKKDKAIELLHELEGINDDPDLKEYCRKMLEILE